MTTEIERLLLVLGLDILVGIGLFSVGLLLHLWVKQYRDRESKDWLMPNFDSVAILTDTVKRHGNDNTTYRFSITFAVESRGLPPVTLRYDDLLAQVGDGVRYRLVTGGVDGVTLKQKIQREGYGRCWITMFEILNNQIEDRLNDYLSTELAKEMAMAV